MSTVRPLTLKYFLSLLFLINISISANAASVSFLKIYKATGSYTLKDLKLNISTSLPGSSFKFTSVNPADVSFSGNNIFGQLTYTSGGQSYTVNGEITGKTSSSGTTIGFYFYETTLLGGGTATGNAWVLVIPGNSVTENSQLSGNSAGVGNDLEAVRVSQSTNVAPVITSNGGASNASINIAEGSTSVTTVTATDSNNNLNASPYSISGGVDAAKFSINSTTGVLTFVTAPNYELPTDIGQNNTYNVQVMVTDIQGATDIQDIEINVADINDNSPVFSGSVLYTVLQGTTYVFTPVVTDNDQNTVLTFSIIGGSEASLFSINSSTGTLSFINNASLGNPSQVEIQVSDGLHTASETITVFVSSSDTNAPFATISSSDTNLSANETCIITFKFNELVQNFTINDISSTGGTLGQTLTQSAVDPTIYTIQFTKNAIDESTSISIAAASYQDMSNNNGLSGTLNLTYDVNAPTVTISTVNSQIAYGETQLVTFTFSENIGSSLINEDLTILNGVLSQVVQDISIPTKYTATVQALSSSSNITITVKNGSYADLAGNSGGAASLLLTIVAPSIDLDNSTNSDTGISSEDNITSNTKPVLTGLAPSNTTVTVTVVANANSYVYSVNVPGSGIWTLDMNATSAMPALPTNGLPEGYIGLTITIAGGSVSASSSFLVDTTAPTAPTVNALTTADNSPVILGTAQISDTDLLVVNINSTNYTSEGSYINYDANTDEWVLSIPDINAIPTGDYSMTVSLYDAAGNVSVNALAANLTVIPTVWTGVGNWNNVSNWSSGILPQLVSDVIIESGVLNIDQNITVKNLTINSNAGVTLNNSKNLIVSGDLILKSDSNSTATFWDNNGYVAVTGNITVEQYFKGLRNWYISSPIASLSTASISSQTGNSVYYYDEPTGSWLSTDNNFETGKGYIINSLTNKTINFTGGQLNTGNLTIHLTRSSSNTSKPGFNLIGNPYPSYVNIQSLIDANPNFQKSIWYRTKNSSTYVFDTYNTLSGIGSNNNQKGSVCEDVAPFQAVWVRMLDGQQSGDLTFSNDMRMHICESGNRLKSKKAQLSLQQVLRLVVSNGSASDETIILFNENASNLFDNYDSPKMFNNNNSVPEIYTMAGTEKVVINGLNNISENTIVPIGFFTGSSGNFKLRLSELKNFSADVRVILIDNLNQNEWDLTAGDEYVFQSSVTNTLNRFSIEFRTISVTTDIQLNKNDFDFNVFTIDGNKIGVSLQQNKIRNAELKVYNAVGQSLTTQRIKSKNTIFTTEFKPGIYLVALENNGNTKTKKILIE